MINQVIKDYLRLDNGTQIQLFSSSSGVQSVVPHYCFAIRF